MSTNDTLTPAQEAQVEVYNARYAAIAMRTCPEDKGDREAAYKAAVRFLKVNPNFNSDRNFEHVNMADHADDPFLVKWSGPNDCNQKKGTVYVVTGNWIKIVRCIQHWLKKRDISDSLCLAQFAAHAGGHATFMRDVVLFPDIEEPAAALDDFVRYCGVVHIYDEVVFVSDSPVAWKMVGDQPEPVWTNAEAHKLGLTDADGNPVGLGD